LPRFHFNVDDGRNCPDQDGVELPDLAAARIVAAQRISDLLRADPDPFWDGCGLRMEITDANGKSLVSMHFVTIDTHAADPQELAALSG
jgi:hypothetical protein